MRAKLLAALRTGNSGERLPTEAGGNSFAITYFR